MKQNLIKILLIINLVLSILATSGVGYLIYKQSTGGPSGDRPSGQMTPPQMNNSQDSQSSQQNSQSNSTSNM
ncbi:MULTISPECIES: hypothetical protein [Bacillus]|uniref:hypothetical protein n=1 Tax=Bacillus TaxID=1386 RepID=UPI0003760960|nr:MULTISPECIES: hypothetical protein [Bacillus]